MKFIITNIGKARLKFTFTETLFILSPSHLEIWQEMNET